MSEDMKFIQKTAWFMLHRLRTAMAASKPSFQGPAEADETFILNSADGARQNSGKLLMLNQCLCLKSSTMANPFGEEL